jgi:hypothetical protein
MLHPHAPTCHAHRSTRSCWTAPTPTSRLTHSSWRTKAPATRAQQRWPSR